ncbi:uncharacterized protein LOC142351616 [Convolutriloba macropyga]|uniref:uncharacterized protein LOC142351616 n=1 Tax=Convolutriloba macropyga TaxID=536237 RepID=UPI003F51C4C3
MPKKPHKVTEVKGHQSKGGRLELAPNGTPETGAKKMASGLLNRGNKLELVAEEVQAEDEGGKRNWTSESEWEEQENAEPKFRSEADAILEDIEQRKVARRNREIQDRLDEINGRIEKTLGNYEVMDEELSGGGGGSGATQFVRDMQELMEIATDAVKKRKYMREVSVFIVGYTSACEQRLNLLEQLEVFFHEQEKQPEVEQRAIETDIDSISKAIDEALDFAQGSMGKLGDLNKEIIVAVENAVTARERAKGNQRLKKQLDKAKEDIQQLSDKLVEVQAELDERLQEMKRVQRQNEELKVHAERAKKLAEDLKVLDSFENVLEKSREVDMVRSELETVQEEMKEKDKVIQGLNQEINRLEAEKEQIREEMHSVIAVKQDTIEALEEQIREMELQHVRDMDALKAEYEEQMENQRQQMEEQLQQEREAMAQHAAHVQSELDETRERFEQLQAEAKTMSEELDLLKNKKVRFADSKDENEFTLPRAATTLPEEPMNEQTEKSAANQNLPTVTENKFKLLVTKAVQCSLEVKLRIASSTQTVSPYKRNASTLTSTLYLKQSSNDQDLGRYSTEVSGGNVFFTPRKPRNIQVPDTLFEKKKPQGGIQNIPEVSTTSDDVKDVEADISVDAEDVLKQQKELNEIQLAQAEQRAKNLDAVANKLDAKMQDIAGDFSYDQFASSKRKISSSDESPKNFSQLVEELDNKAVETERLQKAKVAPRKKVAKKKIVADKRGGVSPYRDRTMDKSRDVAAVDDKSVTEKTLSREMPADDINHALFIEANEQLDTVDTIADHNPTVDTMEAETGINSQPMAEDDASQLEHDPVPDLVQSDLSRLNRETTIKFHTEPSGLSTISAATADDVISPMAPPPKLPSMPLKVTVEPNGAKKGTESSIDSDVKYGGRGMYGVRRDLYKNMQAEIRNSIETKKALFNEEPLAVYGEKMGDPNHTFELRKLKLAQKIFHQDQSSVADDELRARYNQYRKLAMSHITQLEEKVESSKDLEKQLSAKFYEMEKQWNAERQLLLEQAERAENGRKEAEQEAEQALYQLETFLDDMEKLHKMRDYTRLEARHYRKLDEDMQEQYLKTLSPYAKEALMQQLNEGPGDANFAMQTDEVIQEAKKAISEIRSGSRRSQRSAEAQIMMKSIRNMRRIHSKADPMLSEYLRTYDFVHEFKSTITFLFKTKAVDSIVTILDEIEVINFDKDENCFQQIAEMQQQLIILLGEILGVLLRILFQNKLDHRSLAYFQRQLPDLVPRSLFAQIDDSILSGGAELKRLQEQVASLKAALESQRRDYEDKLSKLENEFGQNKEQLRHLMTGSNLQCQRLITMVKRYSAHCSMKLLEENIRRMTSNKGAHIQLIHNFEHFQQKREAQWRAVSVGLAAQRQEAAERLTKDLEQIEETTHGSIFLIKPMFSYRAKLPWINIFPELRKKGDGMGGDMDLSDVSDVKAVPPQVPQTNQPHKKRLLSLPHKSIEPQYIPQHDLMGVAERQLIPMTNLYETESGYVNNEMTGAGLMAQDFTQEPTWKKLDSIAEKVIEENVLLSSGGIGGVGGMGGQQHMWNTPKLLELDINRFMMDHNNIMSPVRHLSNRNNNNLPKHPRSYLSVSRTLPHDTTQPSALLTPKQHQPQNQRSTPPPHSAVNQKPPLGVDGLQRLPPITNN